MKPSPYEVYNAAKARKAARKAKAKRLKIHKPSLAKLKDRLWALLSPAIKARYGSTCYSCGAPGLSGSSHHGGHMFSAGLHSLTRFDPRNLRPQCFRCNISLRSNAAMFAARYIEREGKEAFDAMEAASRVSKKWTRPEIEMLITKIGLGLDHYKGYYEATYGLNRKGRIMTTQDPKPCLPRCRIVAAGFLGEQFVHDMACERHSINISRRQNAPKAEALEPGCNEWCRPGQHDHYCQTRDPSSRCEGVCNVCNPVSGDGRHLTMPLIGKSKPAPEPPKVCDHRWVEAPHLIPSCSRCGVLQAAIEEPPKQEQGEPIDFDAAARTANAWYYANRFEVFGPGRRELARAYLALKAEVEKLNRSNATTMHANKSLAAKLATVEAEHDTLAAKLAEVEKGRDSYIKGKLEEVLLDRNLLQAERDAALRRVEELEVMVEAEACNDGECITVPHATKICVEAREIKRRKESGE